MTGIGPGSSTVTLVDCQDCLNYASTQPHLIGALASAGIERGSPQTIACKPRPGTRTAATNCAACAPTWPEHPPSKPPGRHAVAADEAAGLTGILIKRMRSMREGKGWSARQLGDEMTKAGVPWDRSIVNNLEIGRRKNVTVEELFALAFVLEVSPLSLLDLEKADQAPYPVTPSTQVPRKAVRRWVRFGGRKRPTTETQGTHDESINPADERLRYGSQVGRTLYIHTAADTKGRLVGLVDTPELAALIVEAVNSHLDQMEQHP